MRNRATVVSVINWPMSSVRRTLAVTGIVKFVQLTTVAEFITPSHIVPLSNEFTTRSMD